jgi:hypothetical protein
MCSRQGASSAGVFTVALIVAAAAVSLISAVSASSLIVASPPTRTHVPSSFVTAGCGQTLPFFLSGSPAGQFLQRTCMSLSLISSSGACADDAGPQLVKQFNLSATSLFNNFGTGPWPGGPSGYWPSQDDRYTFPTTVKTPGVAVVVTDANGTLLGAGKRAALDLGESVTTSSNPNDPPFLGPALNPATYTLEFMCAPQDNLRVPRYAPCSCTASPQFAYSVSGGNPETCVQANGKQPTQSNSSCTNATEAQCDGNSGCEFIPSGQQTCSMCVFPASEVQVQIQWVVSCRVPIQSEPGSPSLGSVSDVMCVGTYTEDGTITNLASPFGPPLV